MRPGKDRRRRCRFTSINAENADVHLKSWSLIQTKRRDLYALPAEIRILDGLCPLFPAGLHPKVETWGSGRRRHAVPPAAFPEPRSAHSREL
jgi:hypothetical protein